MEKFIVDSNFFIQAHRATYPLDIATGFWNRVKQLAEDGKIISIDKVKIEIYSGNDELKDWCENNLPEDFFQDSSEVMREYSRVTGWAMSRSSHYLPNALHEFLDSAEADAFVVAYALSNTTNHIIVTQEVSQPERKNKIKIPEPCHALNIQYLNTIEMFRKLGLTF